MGLIPNARALDLVADLGRHLVRTRFPQHTKDAVRQEAVVVQQPGHLPHGRHRAPTVVVPLAGQRQVNAEIRTRVLTAVPGDLGEAGARHHHRCGRDHAALHRADGGHVGGMAHAGVVCVDDEQPVCPPVAQAFGQRHPRSTAVPVAHVADQQRSAGSQASDREAECHQSAWESAPRRTTLSRRAMLPCLRPHQQRRHPTTPCHPAPVPDQATRDSRPRPACASRFRVNYGSHNVVSRVGAAVEDGGGTPGCGGLDTLGMWLRQVLPQPGRGNTREVTAPQV